MATNNAMNLLTNSRAGTFRTCPRKHYLRYELGIAPEQESAALRVGRGFHALQEFFAGGDSPESAQALLQDLDPYEQALVAAMFTVHRERWSADPPHEVVASELSFELPLRNPETGAASPIWRRAGVIDKIYRVDGRLLIKDYKTTTEDISPASDYWTRLMLDQQMTIYVDAARELGYDVQGIFYDVAVRPMHRPKMATPADQRKYTKAGTLYAAQREVDETPDEYCARVADAMREDMGRYFVRHEIARLDSDLEDVRYEQWCQQLAIREGQRSGRWMRNPSACAGLYRCPYLNICHQHLTPDTPAPDGFRILADVHPELARTTPPSGG